MAKVLAPFPWVRGSFALLATLFVLVVAVPRAAKPVRDYTTSPPTTHVEGQVLQVVIAVVVFLPLVCILFLGRRRPIFEVIGWALLALFLLGSFFH
jgi:hypothetical protein